MSNLIPDQTSYTESNNKFGPQPTQASPLIIVIVFIVIIVLIVLGTFITYKRYKLASEAMSTGHTGIAAELLAPELATGLASVF